MKFSVMITTRNRVDDLRRTCDNISQWCPKADEVIICADGCTDDTVKMVQENFPSFRLIENMQSIGSVGSRDRLLNMAKGKFVVSLDDDSYPLDQRFLLHVEKVLSDHPEAAVITFPEMRNGGAYSSLSKTPSSPGRYVSAYANCAAVMRKDFYLRMQGFPRFFGHMYEEPDYALQCYAANSSVWFEPSIVVRHHASPTQRQPVQRHHKNARNEMWSVWLRCPLIWLLPVSLFRMVRQLQYAASEGLFWVVREPIWWLSALKGLPACLRDRKPIKWKIYYSWMQLARKQISDLKVLKTIQFEQ